MRLRNARDLLALPDLDQKLWAALSCPTEGLNLDPATLKDIDDDGDGRVRAKELLGAIAWTGRMLKDPEVLVPGDATLKLASINDADPEGKRLKASALRILEALGKEGAEALSADDSGDSKAIFATSRFNGDGVVHAEAAQTPELQAAIEDIIKAVGSVEDRTAKPGVNAELVETFFKEAETFRAWTARSREDASILPLGDDTAAAHDALEAVRVKIDDYFLRCRFAAFDARFMPREKLDDASIAALGESVLAGDTPALGAIPLASPGVGRALPLNEGLNPVWVDRIATFHAKALEPLLGARSELTEEDWKSVVAKLAPYAAWKAEPHGEGVGELGIERVEALLADDTRKQIEDLIAQDLTWEQEAADVFLVDRLVRYHRDLFQLARNYVSFQDFYAQKPLAIFQAGTLYIDTRSVDLCIRVNDVNAHAAAAASSYGYLAYCDLVRKATGEKMSIVAVLSNGDADFMRVGRNGIFYDRKNRDWDATVVKVVENPMSLRQAFFSPYKKVAKLIETQISNFASSREKEVDAQAASAVEGGTTALNEGPAKTGPSSFDVAKFAGIFAAIGLAIGAISGALAALLSAFVSLAWWQMPLALLGLFLVVSGPSVLLAWLKLRQRSLAPILDANGWAVNSRIPLSVGFGESLTQLPVVPKGARVLHRDPYERPNRALQVAVAVVVVLFLGFGGHFAWKNGMLPWKPEAEAPAAETVVGEGAEAPVTPPEAQAEPAPE